jgi:uncharacterized membrane protein
MTRTTTEQLVKTALMIALTTILTMLAMPVPFTNGYIHLGVSRVFVGVILLGWKYGAVAAAIGPALADVFLGFAQWAPFTLVIKGCMALIMGLIIEKCIGPRGIAISAVITAAIWCGFNFAVRAFVGYQAEHSGSAISSEAVANGEIASPSEFGDFIAAAESKLMLAALLIPVILIVLVIVLRATKKFLVTPGQLIGMCAAGFFMVFGYYICGGLLIGGGAAAYAMSAFSIPANILQFTAGLVLATLLAAALSKTPLLKKN